MANPADLFGYAVTSLMHRQLRSWLTVLGIVIGIASIVALMSIAQGLNDYINGQLAMIGSRYVGIAPGSAASQASFGDPTRPPSAGKLFENDRRRIERISGVEFVSSLIQARVDARYRDEAVSLTVAGVEPDIFSQVQILELASGRFLTGTDKRTMVIGDAIANGRVFKNDISAGSVVRLGADQAPYRVVGVLKKGTGASAAADNMVYIMIDDARALAGESLAENEISAIRLTVKEGADYNRTVEQINNELLSAHKVREEDKDFTIITSDFIVAQVNQITGMLGAFLLGVSGISLIVGGIGIANTMFMSVLERTGEIGTLKAIGASRATILGIFLVESGMIGMLGGLIGALLGASAVLGAKALLKAAADIDLPITVKFEFVAFAALFSFIVGIVSGYIPAQRGAQMRAIDALRDE